MKLLQKSFICATALTIIFSFLTFFSPIPAMADSGFSMTQSEDAIRFEISIKDGGFGVDVPASVPEPSLTVRSAIVSLPAGESGTIQSIIITGPDGAREFGCSNIKIKDGTDLIKACGGPAVLKPGTTRYQANGKDFIPNPDVPFGISLSTNFKS